MDSLVTTDWLAGEMVSGDLRIVDASYHLPAAGRDAAAEYEAAHIPGAVFLDLASLVDAAAPVENTLPPPETFARRMGELGIGEHDRIVVYDDSEVKTAARAWFMLRMFGAQRTAILDGGLAKWKAEGRPLSSGRQSPPHARFSAQAAGGRVRSKADLIGNLASGAEQVVDARGAPRFTGEEPETRPGIASGHIPGSLNLPYKQLFDADGTFRDTDGLRGAFAAAGVDLSSPVVTTCGSGVTACVLAFAMHLLGKVDFALYDGSWTEWGADPQTPKATGAT
ncbi:MAG: 3-mercaptopyruvate sulfurtransferase [Novosphingobium sp.]|nr:3-mercaptopyruvate sulfurtransferase [Novosphingobium sp.]MCP5401182.1 3-mercaptopyruvate sulfurtransferase [Novosphingobium sp.]